VAAPTYVSIPLEIRGQLADANPNLQVAQITDRHTL